MRVYRYVLYIWLDDSNDIHLETDSFIELIRTFLKYRKCQTQLVWNKSES